MHQYALIALFLIGNAHAAEKQLVTEPIEVVTATREDYYISEKVWKQLNVDTINFESMTIKHKGETYNCTGTRSGIRCINTVKK